MVGFSGCVFRKSTRTWSVSGGQVISPFSFPCLALALYGYARAAVTDMTYSETGTRDCVCFKAISMREISGEACFLLVFAFLCSAPALRKFTLGFTDCKAFQMRLTVLLSSHGQQAAKRRDALYRRSITSTSIATYGCNSVPASYLVDIHFPKSLMRWSDRDQVNGNTCFSSANGPYRLKGGIDGSSMDMVGRLVIVLRINGKATLYSS